MIDPTSQTIYIHHADCPETAEYLKGRLMELGFKDAEIGIISSVVGACIGPDAVGVWCYGKKVEMTV